MTKACLPERTDTFSALPAGCGVLLFPIRTVRNANSPFIKTWRFQVTVCVLASLNVTPIQSAKHSSK
ncbi:hypothetical protein HHUSO_G34402 [Huso huso]|uniref:Uncharacterized protein n=1 Tax=Huso huso TaxID=61971 RepID=A0ABR0Y5W3_HUSHU